MVRACLKAIPRIEAAESLLAVRRVQTAVAGGEGAREQITAWMQTAEVGRPVERLTTPKASRQALAARGILVTTVPKKKADATA
jgi:hypothetical protein